MARIAGIDIPRNKKIEFALPYIYGIGKATSKIILKNSGVDPNKRVHELSEEELLSIRNAIFILLSFFSFINVGLNNKINNKKNDENLKKRIGNLYLGSIDANFLLYKNNRIIITNNISIYMKLYSISSI